VPPKEAPPAIGPIDPHATEKRIETALARLEAGEVPITRAAAKEILAFVRARDGEVSRQRTLTYARTLPLAAQRLGADFLAPNRDTPAKLREALAGSKGWTLMSYWAVVSTFWKWKFDRANKDYPSFLHLTVAKKLLARKDETDILTIEEIARLANSTTTVRDRAFVWTLYESGARIGELLGLRYQDVARSDYGGFLLHVDGKTGKRTIPLLEHAVPALSLWLKEHPARDIPTAPLWCSTMATARLAEPVAYAGMVKVLRLTARRAGIQKRVNPHSFRHARATAYAQNAALSSSVMERFFGWRAGSPMAETYVHISGREVEEAMARAIGSQKAVPTKASPTLPRGCGRCNFVNDAADKFCGQCSAPLTLEDLQTLTDVEASVKQVVKLMSQPGVQEYVARAYAQTFGPPAQSAESSEAAVVDEASADHSAATHGSVRKLAR
jgi:integrase